MQPRVLVVGAGRLGTFHLQKVAALEGEGVCTLAGVVDIDEGAMGRARDAHDIPAAPTLRHFDGQAEAVIVASPTVTHLEISATARGVLLQVGHTERFNPAIAAALELEG